MPINLNNITQLAAAAKTNYNPKWFSPALTGSGKKTGVFNDTLTPLSTINPAAKNVSTMGTVEPWGYKKTKNGSTAVNRISLQPLPYYIPRPVTPNKQLTVAVHPSNPDNKIQLEISPYSITIETNDVTTDRTVSIAWLVELERTDGTKAPNIQFEDLHRIILGGSYSYFRLANTEVCYVEHDISQLKDAIKAYVAKTGEPYKFDEKAYDDFINNYDIYEAVCNLSEQWQTNYASYVKSAIYEIAFHGTSMVQMKQWLHALEKYPLPLDAYTAIYDVLKTELSEKDFRDIIHGNININLQVIGAIRDLDAVKSQVKGIKHNKSVPLPATLQRLSGEQLNAVTSDEPYTIIQAGAGCGKTTTIMERIEYMIHCGIPSNDIIVCSFTNAAADNITARNPTVKSMTIAKLIHEVYGHNFHTKKPRTDGLGRPIIDINGDPVIDDLGPHELSNADTIMNAIDIYCPRGQHTEKLKRLIRSVEKDSEGFTALAKFIDENYDAVIDILNKTGQTTLGLEAVLCYVKIEDIIIPDVLQSKHIVLDEVQDTSLFEFIFILKYAAMTKQTLFLVGDCSQTLFEFRNASPNAINCIESSGVFATYPLQINFRSTQPILDYANLLLGNIAANRHAGLQLQANAIGVTTLQNFTDSVQVEYHRLTKKSDWNGVLESVFADTIMDYINSRPDDEKIAFLSYTRREAYALKKMLEQAYPNKRTVSLIPDLSKSDNVLSTFAKQFSDEIKFATLAQGTENVICNLIINKYLLLCRHQDANKAKAIVTNTATRWRDENRNLIKAWETQYNAGALSADEFVKHLVQNMLEHEMRNNAIRQSLLSMKNNEQKNPEAIANANFLISTIHSAKGLEFSHVVVFVDDELNMDEADKRMYYVALTRAIKSELVIAHGTVAHAPTVGMYETCVKILEDRETLAGTI